VIYGRDAERAHLADVVEAARVGMSTALVVSGEAGAGTTTLLDDLAKRADGMRTLRALGVESGSELPFAGLRELLGPLLGEVAVLAPQRRQALGSALGLVEAVSVPDRFLIAAAVLDLLADAAEHEPLLAIVDDAQWLDGASQDALLFVARRLAGEGVALVFGARDGEVRSFDAPGVVRLELTGLGKAAALDLIAHWSKAAPSVTVAARLVAATGGNPLALTELAATLDPAVLAGTAPLPDPLPVAQGVEAAFLDRILRLPERTRSLLLLAALEPAADLALLSRTGEAVGAGVDDLEPAERAGLVRLKSMRVVFGHPLVRSAVEGGATFAQRRRAHLALAAALPPADAERRAWHHAAAAIEPDEQIAADLELLAARARERAGNAAAQAALTRAAELTPETGTRGRRLVAAADAAWQAGRAADALALIDRAWGLVDDPRERARAARLRGLITLRTGSLAEGHRLLMEAARDTAEVDPRTAYMLIGEAAKAGGFSGNPAWLTAAGDLARSFPEPRDDDSAIIRRAVIGIGKIMAGDPAGAVAEIREVLAAAQRIDDPELMEYGITAAVLMGDEALSASLLTRAEHLARERTMIGILPLFLALRSVADYDAGRLAAAAAAADEGARLARESGQTTILAANLAHAARAAAVRGDATRFATAASEAGALATAHGLGQMESIAAHATALHEIGMGRYEAATDALARITHPALAASRASDACEVAIHLDRRADALLALAQLEQLAAAMPLPWVEGLVERARGLTAGTASDRHFERAIALHGDRRPFERARSELAHGESMRGARRRMDARAPLRRALATFERIGAEPWSARADRELRATGESARRRDPSTIDKLTPQELTICRFVAEGLSNREIGARLFLSARTIDYHLRKVLPKLGMGSRTELMRLDFGGDGEGGRPDGSGAPAPRS
jgi:DNA-binding CsgD family transcriptional regulator